MGSYFGSRTLVFEWSDAHIASVRTAIRHGCPALAGVSLKVLGRVDADPFHTRWGGVFVAVSLPHEIFSNAMRDYLRDDGALDVTHALSPYLLGSALDFLEDDLPRLRHSKTTSPQP